MVKAYNASILSRADYLKAQFETVTENSEKGYKSLYKSEEGFLFDNYDFIVLATIIDKVLANEFPKIVEFNKYLNQIGSICTILGLPVI